MNYTPGSIVKNKGNGQSENDIKLMYFTNLIELPERGLQHR